MQVEKHVLQGVPFLLWLPEDARHAPLVIYIHGFTGDKGGGMELSLRLAERGLACLSLDAAMHGERLDASIRDTFLHPMPEDIYPFESGLDRFYRMLKIVEQTAADISGLLDALAGDERLDVQRAGVCGASMGGLIGYLAASREPRLRVAVPQISLGNIAERWQDALLEAEMDPQWVEALHAQRAETERRTAWVCEQLDPVHALCTRFAPRPLLMQCGDLDTDLPKGYSVRLYRQLCGSYAANPQALQLRVYDGVAHRVTSRMTREAADWLALHLLVGA